TAPWWAAAHLARGTAWPPGLDRASSPSTTRCDLRFVGTLTWGGDDMKLGIDGRHALVVGGTGGLGLGAARALAAEGCVVSISSRSLARATAAASDIERGAPGKVHPLEMDVERPDTVRRAVTQAANALGPVSILVASLPHPAAISF